MKSRTLCVRFTVASKIILILKITKLESLRSDNRRNLKKKNQINQNDYYKIAYFVGIEKWELRPNQGRIQGFAKFASANPEIHKIC